MSRKSIVVITIAAILILLVLLFCLDLLQWDANVNLEGVGLILTLVVIIFYAIDQNRMASATEKLVFESTTPRVALGIRQSPQSHLFNTTIVNSSNIDAAVYVKAKLTWNGSEVDLNANKHYNGSEKMFLSAGQLVSGHLSLDRHLPNGTDYQDPPHGETKVTLQCRFANYDFRHDDEMYILGPPISHRWDHDRGKWIPELIPESESLF